MNTINHKDEDRKKYTDLILGCSCNKKVIVAGPGTGKTYTFKEYLRRAGGNKEENLVMTFINPLVDDLSSDLGDYAIVRTFDSFIKEEYERLGLMGDREYFLNANEIISEDYEHIFGTKKDFSMLFNTLDIDNETPEVRGFVKGRNEFYNFIDPSVLKYNLYHAWGKEGGKDKIPKYHTIIIDEFQDFNRLESEIVINHLSPSHILLAGDDDQVLFEFKGSQPECIRELFNNDNDYESFTLPYCSRCPADVVNFTSAVIKYGISESIFPDSRCDKDYIPFQDEDDESVEFVIYKNGFSRYMIESALKKIRDKNASVLILYPYNAEQQAIKLRHYLTRRGFKIEKREKLKYKVVFDALDILNKDIESNLGWRLLLPFIFQEDENRTGDIMSQCYSDNKGIYELISDEQQEDIKNAIVAIKSFQSSNNQCVVEHKNALLKLLNIEAVKITITQDRDNKIKELKRQYLKYRLGSASKLNITLCNIGNSKGLSADYVFVYPFSNEYFQLKNEQEIYNIIVAITRTKKKLVIFEPEDSSKKSIIKNIYETTKS